MNLDALIRWLKDQVVSLPPRPAAPDFRDFEAPLVLRRIPGFASAWESALTQIQERVAVFADALWHTATSVVDRAFHAGLWVGGITGFMLGVLFGVALYSRTIQTVANLNAIKR